MTGIILIDLQKAFYAIDHEVAKLPYIGFSATVLNGTNQTENWKLISLTNFQDQQTSNVVSH